jgi:thiosulfate/3-mercaptopyruvate sulfurtransferase
MNTVITANELQTLLAANKAPLLIDTRDPLAYRQGFIGNAIHFDPGLVNTKQPPVTGLLPDLITFNRLMSGIGLQAEQTVVVYDDSGGPPASRLAWTLQAFGHSNVALLDGGMQAWQAASLPMNTNAIPPANSNYHGALNPDVIADRDYILQNLHRGDIRMVDTRTPAEFRGEDIRAARGGHIPGAVNLNWLETKDPTRVMRFLPATILESILAEKNIRRDQEIICYCQSHQRSSVVFMLLQSMGFKRLRGYPGAWSDWGNQTDTPIEMDSPQL